MALDLSTLTPEEAITAFYIGYYERAADPAGLAFWTDVLEMTSLDLAAIASDFASQDETLDAHPFFSNPTEEAAGVFIAELYLNLFERADVDAEGLQFWTDVLLGSINGTNDMSVGEIIIAIIAGAQDTEAGNDRTTILNKIEVATAFTAAADANGIVAFPEGSEILAESSSIIADVTDEGTTVVGAKTKIGEFFSDTGGGGGVAGEFFVLEEGRKSDVGTEGNDTFEAFNGELQDGDRIDGGSGRDVLTYFNSVDGVAKSPITTNVEQFIITNQSNDLNAVADNNVGGYSTTFGDTLAGNLPLDGTIEVDVEIDGGMMSGITRWEDFDSRADVVIEDARDLDDTDGTFTGDITVAMVSTDPGNVDYAVYFDDPTNTSQNFGTLELRVLDQEAAVGLPAPSATSTGYLTESSLIEFTFEYNGQPITVELADELGVTYGPNVSFQDLRDQIEGATQQALVDAGITDLNFSVSFGAPVTIGVANQFTLPIILTFSVPADAIVASADNILVLGRDSGNNNATDPAGSLLTDRQTVEELIRLNVELDDVGKGSMGGDAMFGAMSTGRQTGDDGTSDSTGIQQFDIEVDRSSKLQTIASTNNALEVVNIASGENNGPNNTTTAVDEQAGNLVVRGVANPPALPEGEPEIGGILGGFFGGTLFGGAATDGPMPGAVPQHNIFGFTDVRVINASGMTGVQDDEDGTVASVDLTAVLTSEIVEKYLDIQDDAADGEADEVDNTFAYTLGGGNDEFLLQMASGAIGLAGTGSREDFNMAINGRAGNDVITTNIGEILNTVKVIDAQGEDHYILSSDNAEDWYNNAVSNNAASFTVNGDTGNDTIWTHGWGDATISDGTGMDVVYTDNSGVEQIGGTVGSTAQPLSTLLDRPIGEHDQIDYVHGAVWSFNAEFDSTGTPGRFDITGATNDTLIVGAIGANDALTQGSLEVVVTYKGPTGVAGTEYQVVVDIPLSQLSKDGTDVTVSEQAINQAAKDAINNDPILSNLLEAVDGPGQALVVYSKTDGDYDATDLEIGLGNITVNTATPVAASTSDYLADYYNTAAANTPGTVATTFTGKLFQDAGAVSEVESDNTIMVAGDGESDLFVLSTSDTAGAQPAVSGGLLAASDLNGASNEVLMFNAGFGTDTVLNFDAGAADGVDNADDVFDFSMITGATGALVGGAGNAGTNLIAASADGTIDWIDLGTVTTIDGADANTTIDAAEVAALLGGGDATQSDHIVILTDTTNADADDIAATNNTGQVWHIVDGAAATGDVTATLIGEIELVGTTWTSLGDDNFA